MDMVVFWVSAAKLSVPIYALAELAKFSVPVTAFALPKVTMPLDVSTVNTSLPAWFCRRRAVVELALFLSSTDPPSATVNTSVPLSCRLSTLPVEVPLFTVRGMLVPPFAVMVVAPPSAIVKTVVELSLKTAMLPVLVLLLTFRASPVVAPVSDVRAEVTVRVLPAETVVLLLRVMAEVSTAKMSVPLSWMAKRPVELGTIFIRKFESVVVSASAIYMSRASVVVIVLPAA